MGAIAVLLDHTTATASTVTSTRTTKPSPPSTPGFIVLDSPVVTYRDPHGDALGDDVDMTSNGVDYFYRDMLTFPEQSIIIENGDPPRDVISQARTHRFALEEFDRAGFFPVATVEE